MTVLYIAGPMSGYPGYNYAAFEDAELLLTEAGYVTLNPVHAERIPGKPETPTWEWYMRQAIRMVLEADGIAVLPGWECSRGARLEVDIAHALQVPVKPVNVWLEVTR